MLCFQAETCTVIVRFAVKQCITTTHKIAAVKLNAGFISKHLQNNSAFVSLWAKSIPPLAADEVRSLFLTDLGDQNLREGVKKETETISQLILAHAFSKTSLTE